MPCTRSCAEGESSWTVVVPGIRWRNCEILRWCGLLCLPPCDLRPERHSRRVNRLGCLGVGCCRYGSCLCCCRPGCGGGRSVGGLCSLQVTKAVASAGAISLQPSVMDFRCLSPGEVVVLDLREETSNGCDECVHGGVFLGSCCRS